MHQADDTPSRDAVADEITSDIKLSTCKTYVLLTRAKTKLHLNQEWYDAWLQLRGGPLSCSLRFVRADYGFSCHRCSASLRGLAVHLRDWLQGQECLYCLGCGQTQPETQAWLLAIGLI